MGVLDNTTITVDYINEKRSWVINTGEGKFKITKFDTDDEIDYGLYDITHPNGSNFYGTIENMNLLEVIPNQTLVKYFLTNNQGQSSGNSPILTLTGQNYKSNKTGIYTSTTDNFNELYDFVLSTHYILQYGVWCNTIWRFNEVGGYSSGWRSSTSSSIRGHQLLLELNLKQFLETKTDKLFLER